MLRAASGTFVSRTSTKPRGAGRILTSAGPARGRHVMTSVFRSGQDALEQDERSFAEAFFSVLLKRFPDWHRYVVDEDVEPRIEINHPDGISAPFVVVPRDGDTITICPFSQFGLDYCIPANLDTGISFDQIASIIEAFVQDRTIVYVRRHRFLWWEAGWDVAFAPADEAPRLEARDAEIIRWPIGV